MIALIEPEIQGLRTERAGLLNAYPCILMGCCLIGKIRKRSRLPGGVRCDS